MDSIERFTDFFTVDASLFNPSNITLVIDGTVAFSLKFQDQVIGQALIANLHLQPGDNLVPTQVHFQPSGASSAAGQLLLENFVQGVISGTLIVGDKDTTSIESLSAALSTISLATTIPPIHQNLITQANLLFPADIATTGVAEATFVLGNPFTASVNLYSVVTNATYHGINLGIIDQQKLNPPIHAPGHTAITSPTLPFVFLFFSSFLR